MWEVSSKLPKCCVSSCAFVIIPVVVAMLDVMLYYIHWYTSNTSVEFTRTPKMAFSKDFPEPWRTPQEYTSTLAFYKLERFAHTNMWWYVHEKMDVIIHNFQFMDFEAMLKSYHTDHAMTHTCLLRHSKYRYPVFRTPNEMKRILTYTMFMILNICHKNHLWKVFYS